MLVTAILDPSALEPKYFKKNTDYRIQAQLLFRGILQNGLFLVDIHGLLLERTLKNLEGLPTQFGQSLLIFFAEIVKNRHYAKCNSSMPMNAQPLEVCSEFQRELSPDALFSSPENLQEFLQRSPQSPIEVLTLSNYIDSDFEKKRQSFSEGSPIFSTITTAELKELFSRVTRFAKHIDLWDKQMGQCNNPVNGANFRRGIAFILDTWQEDGYFQKKKLEIWAFESKRRQPRERTKSQEILKKEIVGLLEAQFRAEDCWEIDYHLNEDPDDKWHARYLQTEAVILNMERGFDFIERNGSPKHTHMSLCGKAQQELEDFKGMFLAVAPS